MRASRYLRPRRNARNTISAASYRVIPNGVDVDRFHPDNEPFEQWRSPDKINIVFVGRLDPRKGVNHLIAAIPQVVEKTRGRARFLIVGDSYLRRKLEARRARGHA